MLIKDNKKIREKETNLNADTLFSIFLIHKNRFHWTGMDDELLSLSLVFLIKFNKMTKKN